MDQMGHSEQMSLSRSDGTRTLTLLRIHAGVSHKHEKQKAHIAGYKQEAHLAGYKQQGLARLTWLLCTQDSPRQHAPKDALGQASPRSLSASP